MEIQIDTLDKFYQYVSNISLYGEKGDNIKTGKVPLTDEERALLLKHGFTFH